MQVKIFSHSMNRSASIGLGTPNMNFGGPGIGEAGEVGSIVENSMSQGKVLIISEDGNTSDIKDQRYGGSIQFDFMEPVALSEIGLLDTTGDTQFKVLLIDGSIHELVSGVGT